MSSRIFSSWAAGPRLGWAREWLGEQERSRPLWIVGAGSGVGRELIRSVLNPGEGSFGWRTGSLVEFAAYLAGPALAASGRHLATQPFFEAVCARAVAEAEAAGEIAPYGIIADRPGLPRAVARTVSEVLAARLGVAQLPSGLSRLASGSLALLEQQGAILQPALFELASEALSARAGLPPVLFLDPPASSLCERTFLVSALRACPDVAVTVPSQDIVLRRELELTAGSEIEDTGPEAEDGLSCLQRFLFAEVSPQPAPADDSVVLFSAPGEGRECVEIVRRIQQAASSGTPYDRMAVFLRSEDSHRGPLEEALQRGCVPAHFASGSSVPDTSARALLVLLACSDEGLSIRRFGEYLSLRQLGSAVNHRVWEQLLLEARAISGMARIERRLALLTSVHHRSQLALLREQGLALFRALEALPDADSWGGWADRLTALARLGLAEPSSVSAALRELRAMDSLRRPALAELRLFLARRLGERRIAPPHRVHGAVFVGSTSEARGRSFERVFVPGLSEGVFPMKVVEDPMLLDAVRVQLSSDLETNRSRGADERLALQLAASAAEQQLVLSWSRINAAAGRPRVPSFYALEVLRASRGMLPSFESLAREADRVGSARLAWPAPEDPWVAIDEAEHDLALFARVRRRPESEARGTMSYLLGANVHLGRSLRARARRWNLGTYSSADGLLQPRAQGLAAIAEHGLSKRSYSATALETFASCPYRFLLHTVHRLRKRKEPEAIEYVDRRTRGELIHSIQFALLTELRDTGYLPLSQARLEEATVILDARIDAVAAQSFEELAPAIERVWQDAVAGIRADLREWLRRIATEQRWVPHRFELSFGLLGEGGRDEASQADPVALDCGLSLRGSIDLVEQDSSGRLRLTDYKSGSADVTQGAVVLGGRSLQPVLYALAAEKLFPGAVAEAGRLDYCTTKGQFREVIVPLGEEGRRGIESLARVLSSCLDRGAFLASPREGVCGGCDYRSVCGPHEEVRIRRKSAVAIEDLIKLRSLR